MPQVTSGLFWATSGCRFLFAVTLLVRIVAAAESRTDAEQRAFVQNRVLPLLESRCFECHGGEQKPKGGLILTNRVLALKGGDSGPAIVPGKSEESPLIAAVRYEGLEMPPQSKMPDAEIQILVDWVRMGAPWPADLQPIAAQNSSAAKFPLEQRRDSHWAWQPIRNPPPPGVRKMKWPADPLDQFILAKLEAAGLEPAADADRRTLIRRLCFDITGLAPSPDEVQTFVDDPSEDRSATATVVDRLLDSPEYGERWARHWLDLVRYAETLGHEFDYPLHHAWQYRDYVIRAITADVPYDDFIREHVAGDLLPNPRQHPTEHYNESLIGTGFWFLHEAKHAPVDVEYEEAVRIDNQIDVFARAFMGLTVACARCHDHKFDAISTEDYYALFGILQSSRQRTGWLDPGHRIRDTSERLSRLRSHGEAVVAGLRKHDSKSGEVVRYAYAALELFRGQPQPGEHPTAGLAGVQRNVNVVAKEASCHPDLLTKWAEQLANAKSQELSSPFSLLARIARSSPTDDVGNVVQQWKKEMHRSGSVTSQTVLYADFSSGLPKGWSTTGPAFTGPNRSTVAPGSQRHRLADVGFSSADLSHRFCGSLYSPTFEINHPEILIRIAGEGIRVRLVIDGYVMAYFNGLLFRGVEHKVDTKGEFQWLRLGGDIHRYLGKHAYLEVMDEGDGWFVIDEVHFVTERDGTVPAVHVPVSSRQLANTLQENPQADPVSSAVKYTWPTLFTRNLLPSSTDENWTTLRNTWAEVSQDAAQPVPVLAITDGTGETQHVFVRGNHQNPGRVAARAFLKAIAGPGQTPIVVGSGRRELAQRLLAEDNPFPARVAVNRIWHHLFGRGIVSSTDDFGVLGDRPSHPDLLDHLATHFRHDGWSVKRLIRKLVLSRTYRMSSTNSATANEKDPNNVLFNSARIRRLQGEVIRDTMLQMAGRLDRSQFGPPVPVTLTAFMEGRGRPKSGPLDGNGRRSIYISVNRNFLSPFMLAFDTPAPMSTRGRRTVSNVPAQALTLLNDEFTHQQARRWAARLLARSTNIETMITMAWTEALGREPSDRELTALRAFARQQAEQHDEVPSATTVGEKTMQDVCHAIMNTKEFIYIR